MLAHHPVGLMVGAVGERRPGDHVADRIDAPVGGAEVAVDGDAVGVIGDPGDVEAEPVDVRRAAGATSRCEPSTATSSPRGG